MARTKTFDPFRLIPSASAVRCKLTEVEEEARRLRVLLRTAEEIEAVPATVESETRQDVVAA